MVNFNYKKNFNLYMLLNSYFNEIDLTMDFLFFMQNNLFLFYLKMVHQFLLEHNLILNNLD